MYFYAFRQKCKLYFRILYKHTVYEVESCVAAIGAMYFSCVARIAATHFLFFGGDCKKYAKYNLIIKLIKNERSI